MKLYAIQYVSRIPPRSSAHRVAAAIPDPACASELLPTARRSDPLTNPQTAFRQMERAASKMEQFSITYDLRGYEMRSRGRPKWITCLSADRFGDGRLVLLPLRDFDVERAPFGVDERVDLCGESTSRTTQCICDDPPFPLAASWWARTTEASMITPSSSTSS